MAQVALPRARWPEVVIFWSMVLASFGLVFAVAVLPDCRRSVVMESKVVELRQANQTLAERVDSLETEREALNNDPFYIEKMARRMLGLRRPGESVVIGMAGDYAPQEAQRPAPSALPSSIVCEVIARLEPFATDPAVRLMAVVLALVNLLAAFLFFGRVDNSIPVRRCSS